MRTIKDYTPELRAKAQEYVKRVRDTYLMPFNRDASKLYVQMIYKIAKRKPPKVFFASTRLEYAALCILIPKLISKHKKATSSELNSELGSELRSELGSELGSELRSELGSELDSELRSELRSELYSELDSEIDSELYSELGSELKNIKSYWLWLCSAYSPVYTTWYWFISKEFNIQHKSKAILKDLYTLSLKTHIGRCFFNPHYVIVLKRPSVKFNQSRLHCEDGFAVDYGKYGKCYWKGVRVPNKLILTPEKITKEDLRENQNAEVRRAFIEKLGVKKYFEILSDGEGLRLIDSDTDNQGNEMSLYDFDFEGDKIQVLECQCPSTDRIYNLYPPNQNCKNVWAAKASTFRSQKLFVRHGDVGLVKEGFKGEPIKET